MLEFDKIDHVYTLNGEVLPSVTQIISPLQDFSGINAEVLANKARFGSQIHKMCALYCAGTLDEESLSEVQLQYLEQFKKFLTDCPIDLSDVQTEQPLASARLKYAGTPDVFTLDRFVIDLKTRKFNSVTDPIQLAAYDMLITENFNTKFICRDLWVLQLDSDSYHFQRAMPNRDKKEYQNRFKFLLNHYKHEQVVNKTIDIWRKA